MSWPRRLITAARSGLRRLAPVRSGGAAPSRDGTRVGSMSAGAAGSSPGRAGATATEDVDAASLGDVRISYAPDLDGDPDAGEVVWTWVPYEEHDGRGKDRPVLVVAAEPGGSLLGIMLTSKRHGGADYVAIGQGGWDVEHRPSWAVLDRIVRLWPDGMRREGAALDAAQFERVAARLRTRNGWR